MAAARRSRSLQFEAPVSHVSKGAYDVHDRAGWRELARSGLWRLTCGRTILSCAEQG
jgi:hypothetical protein